MTSTFTTDIRSFNASCFIKALRVSLPALWETNKTYTLGDIVFYGNGKYVVVESGTSGDMPPTHTIGIETDGLLNWIYIESIVVNNTYKNNLYFYIAQNTPWVNENSPPIPTVKDVDSYTLLDNIISLQKINYDDIKLGATRYNWVSGNVYEYYDSNKNILDYSLPFYVLTDEHNIYKCLNNNNNSPSTSKPTTISTGILTLADGYSWKYLGSISSQDAVNFITNDFFPVDYKIYNDGSEQWNVQQSAKVNSISTFIIQSQVGVFTTPIATVHGIGTGCVAYPIKAVNNTIREILIDTCGENYSPETYVTISEATAQGTGGLATAVLVGGAISSIVIDDVGFNYTTAIVLIVGDGTGASATCTIGLDTGIQDITITSPGINYTTAKVYIFAGTSGCVGKSIMSPIEGHGSNIVSELSASNIIIGNHIQTNDYFLTGNTSTFRQTGIITDIVDIDGISATNQYYVGFSHPDYETTLTLNKIKRHIGHILYVSNIIPVTRTVEQEEYVKVSFSFS